MFLIHLRLIYRRYKKDLKNTFEIAISSPTYWIDSEPRFFSPPKEVRYANDDKEIIAHIRELTQHWTILNNLKDDELFPILKMIISTQTRWRKRESTEFLPGSVSDHVYEM